MVIQKSPSNYDHEGKKPSGGHPHLLYHHIAAVAPRPSPPALKNLATWAFKSVHGPNEPFLRIREPYYRTGMASAQGRAWCHQAASPPTWCPDEKWGQCPTLFRPPIHRPFLSLKFLLLLCCKVSLLWWGWVRRVGHMLVHCSVSGRFHAPTTIGQGTTAPL